MTDQASFQSRVVNGVGVVEVSGEIDIANIDQFKAFAADAARDDTGNVILAFEKVTYLDSHTLEAVVNLSKRLQTNRRRLVVVAPKDSPSGRIMRTTGIDLAVALCETLDDALQSAAEP